MFNYQSQNPLQMIAQFKQFAQTITPEGAKQKVEELLKNGQMTKEQFESLKQQADTFSKFLR